MGMMIDTSVFIAWERTGSAIDFTPWQDRGQMFVSAITVSELLVGVRRANTEARRLKRSRFVELVIEILTVLNFTTEVARVHANLSGDQSEKGQPIGAYDSLIAATALHHSLSILTANVAEFSRVSDLEVVSLFDTDGHSPTNGTAH